MPLLSPADQQRLTEDFAKFTRPIRLVFFTQTFGCDTCLQTRQIIDELPPLSDRISIEEVNVVLDRERASQFNVERVPAIAIVTEDDAGVERDTHMRFLGTPSGYEFIALVRAVTLAGTGDSALSEHSRERIATITEPTTIYVFSTPTCPHCPKAVTLAHELAWANPNVTAYAIAATEFPDLTRKYQVTGVPKTIVNDTIEVLGAVPEDVFVDQALAAQKPAVSGDEHA